MSFEACMSPYLNSQTSEDEEWYVKATHQALNAYMEQLETYMSIPQNNQVNGITIVPRNTTSTCYNKWTFSIL